MRTINRIIKYIKGLRGEALRYIIAGVLTTLVNFSVFTLLVKLMRIDVTISNVTSISVSILFAYTVNKHYVFKNRCASKLELMLEFAKFVGSRLFTLALEVGAVYLFVEVLERDELLGKIVSQVFVVIGNYVISKALVFRKKAGGAG